VKSHTRKKAASNINQAQIGKKDRRGEPNPKKKRRGATDRERPDGKDEKKHKTPMGKCHVYWGGIDGVARKIPVTYCAIKYSKGTWGST